MPTGLLVVLLLAATVDPRLAEPLRLLAEVGARESLDGHYGPYFAELPESIDLTVTVGDLPRGAVGYFDHGLGSVVIADSIIGEDPRAVAVILAHEVQHALDMHRNALGLLGRDCLAIEVRGFNAEVTTTRLFWPDELPSGIALERRIAAVVRDYERNGAAGLEARITGDDRYREACAEWPAWLRGRRNRPLVGRSGPCAICSWYREHGESVAPVTRLDRVRHAPEELAGLRAVHGLFPAG